MMAEAQGYNHQFRKKKQEHLKNGDIKTDEGGKRNMCKAWIDQREEGITEGREEGMERINALNNLLILNDRIEDLKRGAVDKEYQKKLLMEFFPDEAGTATA